MTGEGVKFADLEQMHAGKLHQLAPQPRADFRVWFMREEHLEKRSMTDGAPDRVDGAA
jgi:hypothetical protein